MCDELRLSSDDRYLIFFCQNVELNSTNNNIQKNKDKRLYKERKK